jgi:hypothetical protein
MYLYFTLCRDTESSLKQSTGKPVLRGHHLGQRKSGHRQGNSNLIKILYAGCIF